MESLKTLIWDDECLFSANFAEKSSSTVAVPAVVKQIGGIKMPGYPDDLKFYQPIHFKIEEVIPPDIFKERGVSSIQLMDWRVLYTLDCIWELANQAAGKRVRIIVNDWLWGGNRVDSGFRGPGSNTGKWSSQHRFGRGADSISPEMPASWFRNKIIENNRLFPYITYVEDGVDWLHFDTRASTFKGIHLFKP